MQVNLRARVKRGDGVAFDAGMPEEQEEGGLVYEVKGGGLREEVVGWRVESAGWRVVMAPAGGG